MKIRNSDLLDLYTEYLISSCGLATATGMSLPDKSGKVCVTSVNKHDGLQNKQDVLLNKYKFLVNKYDVE